MVGKVLPMALGAPGLTVESKQGDRFRVGSAVPGDTLRVFPWSGKGAPDGELTFADVDAVLDGAKARVEAPCPLVDRCGGCVLQEMAYPAQLKAKQGALDKLVRTVGSDAEPSKVCGLNSSFGYRTKLVMPSAGKAGALRFGFNRRHSMQVLPAEGCPVQHPLALALLAMARATLDESAVAPTSSRGTSGWLHGISIRIDSQSGQGELMLSARSANVPDSKRLIPRLLALPHVTTLGLCVNPSRSGYPFDGELSYLSGAPRTAFTLSGQRFALSLGSFFQTSEQGAQLLVDKVGELLPERMESFADLYGGVGVFSRLFADRWRRALVAESSDSAVGDLKNALKHGDRKIEVLHDRVEAVMDRVLRAKPDVVLVDPPRRGCHPRVLEALASLRPKPTILYVACSAQSFARDCKRLLASGYRLDRVTWVDMFPHTTHLEIVGRLLAR